MNARTIPIQPAPVTRQRRREGPKGRQVDPQATREVAALIGESANRRDLLIEHLHKIQDHFGHLSAAHLAALAKAMGLAQAEAAG